MQIIRVVAAVCALLSAAAFAAQDAVVFKGEGAEVSYTDIEHYIVEKMPANPDQKAQVLNRAGIYREMAEMIYTVRVLAAEAESMPDFDREQAQWSAQMVYQRSLMQIYRQKYITYMLKDVDWEKTAKEAYRVQKDQYMTEEMVNASHILIKAEGRSDKDAQDLAGSLRQRALDGEDFEKLAREYSQDPSAAGNGGNLGFFKRGNMVKPFDKAVFAMQDPGSISEVINTKFGYHVIKFHARQIPQQMAFDDVKAPLIDELQKQMGNQVWQDKVMAIRSSTDIVVDEKLLLDLEKKYKTRTGPE